MSPKIKNEASGSVIYVRFPNGVDLHFKLGYIERFANAAVRLGMTEMGIVKVQDSYRIFAQNKNGILTCVTVLLRGNVSSIESIDIDLENVAQEENNIERENLKEDEKGALYHQSGNSGMISVSSSTNDTKLRVSSLPLDTEVEVVTIEGEPLSYEEAKKAIDRLPNSIAEERTPEGVGELRISKKSREKLQNQIGAVSKVNKQAYMDMIPHLGEIISNSILLEEHRDRMKSVNGKRYAENESDPNIDKVQRLYGITSINGVPYRVKTTVRVYGGKNRGSRLHNYDITEIELLAPNSATPTPNERTSQTLTNNSISLAKLIEGVGLSYERGKLLADAMKEAQETRNGKGEDHRTTISRLVDQLKKSGLAEDVIVDKEAFEKKLEEVDNVQFLKDGEQVYGFVSNGVVYLNPDLLNTNTPIHEFAHLWNSLIKQKEPELWNEGVGLVKDSSYMDEVRKNPYYSQLSEEDQLDEAMAMAIGDLGAKEIESKGVRGASLRAWIGKVWDKIRSFLGVPKREYKNLDDFARTALNDILGGEWISEVVKDGKSNFQRTDDVLSNEIEEIKRKAGRIIAL